MIRKQTPRTATGGQADERWLAARVPGWLVPVMSALAAIRAAVIIAQAGLLAALLDAALVAGNIRAGMALVLLGVLLARGGLDALADMIAAGASSRVRAMLRSGLFRRLAEAGPEWSARAGSGALTSVLVEHVEQLDPWFARFLPRLTSVALLTPAILIAVFVHDWLAALLLLVGMPLIAGFMVLIGMGSERLGRRRQLALERLGGAFHDRLRGLDVIRRFGAESRETARMAGAIEGFRERTMQVLKLAFVSTAVLEFFSAVAIATVAIYIGLGLLGYLHFGPASGLALQGGVFVLLLAPEFFAPLRLLAQSWHDRASALSAAARIRQLLDTPPARDEPQSPRPVSLAAPCRISVRELALARHGRAQILQGIDLDIAPGEPLLITGASGSGKSTLLRLLAGLITSDAGSIRLNGIDLADISRARLARMRGWMSQRDGMLAGAIADNILPRRTPADTPALERALELSGAAAFMARLPDGIETRITQDGEGLSGGQLRRIALARALVHSPPLLLLDEPSASLDPETATGIWQTLRELAMTGNMTIVCASHDRRAQVMAGRTLVLAAGRLREARA